MNDQQKLDFIKYREYVEFFEKNINNIEKMINNLYDCDSYIFESHMCSGTLRWSTPGKVRKEYWICRIADVGEISVLCDFEIGEYDMVTIGYCILSRHGKVKTILNTSQDCQIKNALNELLEHMRVPLTQGDES